MRLEMVNSLKSFAPKLTLRFSAIPYTKTIDFKYLLTGNADAA